MSEHGGYGDCVGCEGLTAERDALRVASKACRERNEVLCAERDALKAAGEKLATTLEEAGQEVGRLRVEVERERTRCIAAEIALLALREAAEAAVRHHLEWDDRKPLERLCECKDCVWCTLIAALVKVTP